MSVEKNKGNKLFASESIYVASLIGGPLAAGILLGYNYKKFDDDEAFKLNIFVTIVSFLASVILILIVQFNDIPKGLLGLLPFIYLGATFLIFRSHQAERVENLLAEGWKTISVSKSLMTGAGSLILSLMFISLMFVIFKPTNVIHFPNHDLYLETDDYVNLSNQFFENERVALVLYSTPKYTEPKYVIKIIDQALPLWEKNIKIIEKMQLMEDHANEMGYSYNDLLKYCNLRVEQYRIFKRIFSGETGDFKERMEKIDKEINDLLENKI